MCACTLAACSEGNSCARDTWTFESGTVEGVSEGGSIDGLTAPLSVKPFPVGGGLAISAEVALQGKTRGFVFKVSPCALGNGDLREKRVRATIMVQGPAPTSLGVALNAEGRSFLELSPARGPAPGVIEVLTGRFPNDLEGAEVTAIYITFFDVGAAGWSGTLWLADVRIE